MQEINFRHCNQVHFSVKSTLDTIPTEISFHNKSPTDEWATMMMNSGKTTVSVTPGPEAMAASKHHQKS